MENHSGEPGFPWKGPFFAAWFVSKETADGRVGLNQIKIDVCFQIEHENCDIGQHGPPYQVDFGNTDIIFCTRWGQ